MTDQVRFSRLKWMARSPLHYRHASVTETAATRGGTLVHAMLLGGDVIRYDGERSGSAWAHFKGLVAGEEYVIFDGPRTGKAWKAAKEAAAGALIVTSEDIERAAIAREVQCARLTLGFYPAPIVTTKEYDAANRCADAVRADPIARDLLVGAHEVELSWRSHDLDCGGRIDVLGHRRIADLKTTRDSEPDWFGRYALRNAYPAQLDWYSEGARENGFAIDESWIVAVETRAPYPVTCHRLTPRALEKGRALWCSWMERLRVCLEADEWPGYVQCAVDLDAPDDEIELIYADETEGEAEAA